jgi:hypothetical protein
MTFLAFLFISIAQVESFTISGDGKSQDDKCPAIASDDHQILTRCDERECNTTFRTYYRTHCNEFS